MRAIEFIADANDGIIEIPQKYRKEFKSSLKVILLKAENDSAVENKNSDKTLHGFGILAHRANPDLWDKEDGAWERAVKENHENN